jgi:hypothetical protein
MAHIDADVAQLRKLYSPCHYQAFLIRYQR